MRNILLAISCALVLVACSSENYKSRTVENYYQSAGIEKYFLSDLPAWANYSSTAGCFRKTTIRFFDLDLLMKSFNIDFDKAIQIQATFNDDYNRLYEQYKDRTIPLNDEQLLFFKASEKINGKIKIFEAPTFKRVHLIWVDSLLKNPEEERKLKAFLKSPINDEGVPVLVSMCFSKKELEEIFPDVNYKMLTSEFLSLYNVNGSKIPLLHFQFDQFFNDKQDLYFYSREKLPNNNEFIGVKKFVNF